METGVIGPTTADRVRAVRERRGWSQRELSGRLIDLGRRSLVPSSVAKVETGARRVDVDDLVALAVALNVGPAVLLLPEVGRDEPVQLTETTTVPAWVAMDFLQGHDPLPSIIEKDGVDNTDEEYVAFDELQPAWARRAGQHPAVVAAERLVGRVRRVLAHADKPSADLSRSTTLASARRALEVVADELDELEVVESPRRTREGS